MSLWFDAIYEFRPTLFPFSIRPCFRFLFSSSFQTFRKLIVKENIFRNMIWEVKSDVAQQEVHLKVRKVNLFWTLFYANHHIGILSMIEDPSRLNPWASSKARSEFPKLFPKEVSQKEQKIERTVDSIIVRMSYFLILQNFRNYRRHFFVFLQQIYKMKLFCFFRFDTFISLRT